MVCDSDITPDLRQRVLQALIDKGYMVRTDSLDGEIEEAIKLALVEFQENNELPEGHLDFETLTSLGIEPPY